MSELLRSNRDEVMRSVCQTLQHEVLSWLPVVSEHNLFVAGEGYHMHYELHEFSRCLRRARWEDSMVLNPTPANCVEAE